MTTRMFDLIDTGWIPHTAVSDPVLWRRREHNQIADFLVNHAMDTRSSWMTEVPPAIPDFTILDANIVCHSDGGTRAGSCSAAAWILEAIVSRDGFTHTFTIASRGIFLDSPVSSFTAEAIALDDAVAYVSRMVSGRAGLEKRARHTPA